MPYAPGPYTIVSFHAHPDDEALYTAGTLARAAAEGHRVILVTATAGEIGLVSSDLRAAGDLGRLRSAELQRAAAAIGCHDVRFLGYADSGMDGTGEGPWRHEGRDAVFCEVPVDDAAKKLAAILSSVGADVLTVYDPAGGYGHPDHIQVHRVGVRAAALAGTPVVLEATVDRRAFLRVLRVLSALHLAPVDWAPERFRNAYADPDRLTHRINVRRYRGAKRAAMAAHASQATADEGVRTLAAFLRLPRPLFRVVFGHEWFVERGRRSPRPLSDDIFESLRARAGGRQLAGTESGRRAPGMD